MSTLVVADFHVGQPTPMFHTWLITSSTVQSRQVRFMRAVTLADAVKITGLTCGHTCEVATMPGVWWTCSGLFNQYSNHASLFIMAQVFN